MIDLSKTPTGLLLFLALEGVAGIGLGLFLDAVFTGVLEVAALALLFVFTSSSSSDSSLKSDKL